MSKNDKEPEIAALGNEKCPTFDEALSQTKFGLLNYILIAISGTILTAVLLETLGMSYVIAVAECDLGLSTREKGILSAVAFVGVIVSSHLWGYLADTQGRHRVIVPTLFLAFVCTVVSSCMTHFWAMTVCRFLTGFFVSGSSATVFAYLGEFHTSRYGSRAIMGASFVFGVGGLLLPGVAFVVINQTWEFTIPLLDIVYRPWRLFLVVCGLPSLMSGLALLYFPESPKFVYTQGDAQGAIATIQWMHRVNSAKGGLPLQIESIRETEDCRQITESSIESSNVIYAVAKSIWKQTAPLFMDSHLRKTVLICILQFGSSLAAQGMYMFFPGILNQMAETQNSGIERTTICQMIYSRRNVTETTVPETGRQCAPLVLDPSTYEFSFILEAIYTVGFALIAVIINAVGRLSILVFVFACCGVSGLLVIFVDIPLAAIWFYLILLLSGFCTNVVNAVTVDLYPTNLRAMAVCISMMIGRLGSVAGANLLGFLLDDHCELTFGIPGALLLLCGALSFFIPNIWKRVGRSETTDDPVR